MALNGKPGVSQQKKKEIIETAQKSGYDFSRIYAHYSGGTIKFCLFTKFHAIIDNSEFFNSLIKAIEKKCKEKHVYFEIEYVSDIKTLSRLLSVASSEIMTGVLLLATEMSEMELRDIYHYTVPIVVLDCAYNTLLFNYVCINNRQEAYMATNFLLKQFHTQPGYLQSDYSIMNFRECSDGFFNAIRDVGLHTSRSAVHKLSPSLEGAYSDMKQILQNGENPVRCYFADNDLIAMGAIQELKEFGYRIPRDVAIIGFDNIPMCTKSDYNLSSIDVPKQLLGTIAVNRLLKIMKSDNKFSTTTTLINTSLVPRLTTEF